MVPSALLEASYSKVAEAVVVGSLTVLESLQ